jgi:hypothetical protein
MDSTGGTLCDKQDAACQGAQGDQYGEGYSVYAVSLEVGVLYAHSLITHKGTDIR